MKIIFLSFIVFFNIIYIANAIPVPALVIWYDFILLATPFILSIFSFIYFYFKKYIYKINILLYFLIQLLYSIHYYITGEVLFFNLEYIALLWLGFWLLFTHRYKNINIYNLMIVWILIILSTFLIKIDYNLYKFHMIHHEFKKNIYSNFVIKGQIYKDNFMVIYAYDLESKENWYIVIGIWKEVEHCHKKWIYNVCTWWSRWVWEWLSILAYKIIK
jgi:hypothetical protein